MLATGSMLHPAGTHDVETAAQAVEALRPVACAGASVLFALGVIGVGFIAIPIMTAGAAYDLGQALNWKNCSLHATPAPPRNSISPSPRSPQLPSASISWG
jgi:Mn2+/Fe2+ NRAMP family transporter